MDEESLGVIEKGFPVGETVLPYLECSDELLEFRHDGMRTDGGGVSGLRELRLVAVVYCSFVPPRHLVSSSLLRSFSLCGML